MAMARVVLSKMLPRPENAVINAECIHFLN